MTLLWHRDDPIGICVFTSPPKTLAMRNRYFGLSGNWNRTAIRSLNAQLYMLSRVVIHPVFRGVGIARHFVRRSCELCPVPWIETMSEMGHINPFFERAGFQRVGTSTRREQSRAAHSSIYGRRKSHGQTQNLLTQETYEKSRFARPVYYIFDNRQQHPQ